MANEEKKTEGDKITLETRQQQPIPEGWNQKFQKRQQAIDDRWRFVEHE